MTEDRIQSLLAKQAAAVEKRHHEERVRAEAAERAAARRAEVEQLWAVQSPLIDEEIAQLNELMAPNDVQLYRHQINADLPRELVRVEISLDRVLRGGELQHLTVRVSKAGQIDVSMGTKNHWPAKQDSFPIEEATANRWRQCLLDFLEINTPDI